MKQQARAHSMGKGEMKTTRHKTEKMDRRELSLNVTVKTRKC